MSIKRVITFPGCQDLKTWPIGDTLKLDNRPEEWVVVGHSGCGLSIKPNTWWRKLFYKVLY